MPYIGHFFSLTELCSKLVENWSENHKNEVDNILYIISIDNCYISIISSKNDAVIT